MLAWIRATTTATAKATATATAFGAADVRRAYLGWLEAHIRV